MRLSEGEDLFTSLAPATVRSLRNKPREPLFQHKTPRKKEVYCILYIYIYNTYILFYVRNAAAVCNFGGRSNRLWVTSGHHWVTFPSKRVSAVRLSMLRIRRLFSQSSWLVLHDPQRSGIKFSQACGHSCRGWGDGEVERGCKKCFSWRVMGISTLMYRCINAMMLWSGPAVHAQCRGPALRFGPRSH